jgi:hypothetical protein
MVCGLLLGEADAMEAAIPFLEEAHSSSYHAVLGPNDSHTLWVVMNLANVLTSELGRTPEVHQMLGAEVAGYTISTAYGEVHADTLDTKMCGGCITSRRASRYKVRPLFLVLLSPTTICHEMGTIYMVGSMGTHIQAFIERYFTHHGKLYIGFS